MSHQQAQPSQIYGLMAEFASPEELTAATRGAYEHGYRMMEAYTPFPVDGLLKHSVTSGTGLRG